MIHTEAVGFGSVAVEVFDETEGCHENTEAEVVLVASVDVIRVTHPLDESALFTNRVKSTGSACKEEKHVT